MVWPAELKDRVRDKVGSRGLTEFVTEAVDLHLRGGADALAALEKELNETKNLAQLLADRTVMGGSNVDRLEAFMELELPSWMDTSGWPSEFAKRVHPETAEEFDAKLEAGEPVVLLPELPPEVVRDEPTPQPEVTTCTHCGGEGCEQCNSVGEWLADPKTTVEEKVEKFEALSPQETTGPDEDEFFAQKTSGSDLFAKVMAATGGDPLMNELKPASEVPAPEAKPMIDACPNCGDELVNGECWNCM